MESKKVIAYGFIALTVIIVIVGIFILPDPMVMQIRLSGDAGTTFPKWLGLTFMLGLGLVGGLMVLANKDETRITRSYLLMAILLIVFVLVFVFNL